MKKYTFFILILILSLTSCQWLVSSEESSQSESRQTTSFFSSSIEESKPYFVAKDYLILQDIYPNVMPSQGIVNALVVPIAFSDYPADKSNVTLEDIENVFFGSEETVDWESVRSYYDKSSYGQLSIQGEVLTWYEARKPAKEYENYDNLLGLLEEVLRYHQRQGVNFTHLDSDNNGYIDAIYFLYTHPVNDSDPFSNWWAFQSEFENVTTIGERKVGRFVFAGLDFLSSVTGSRLDATTYIHETGHLLGLDDYYDYDDQVGPSGGLGKSDMMEINVGDHNSFSKLLLGWIEPMVVLSDANIPLLPLMTQGDVILLTNEWHNSIFDEYLLIDIYSPTDLNIIQSVTYNKNTCETTYDFGCNNYLPSFSQAGARMYHVNGILGSGQDLGYYDTIFKYNNSVSAIKQIKLIEADGRRDIEEIGYAEDDDLFMNEDHFNLQTRSNYFLSNQESIKFSVEFYQENDSFSVEIRRVLSS